MSGRFAARGAATDLRQSGVLRGTEYQHVGRRRCGGFLLFLVADQPVGERPRLYGLYSGHPLTSRGVYGFGELPDRITLFKNNLQEHSADLTELRARVRVTLVHEIGHYFGLDDAKLHELGWA